MRSGATASAFSAATMIRIAITPAAFEAIAAGGGAKARRLKSILFAFALIGTIGAAHARAATCQDLRAKLNQLESLSQKSLRKE